MLKYNCFIFDLDGTIYFGDTLAPRANEVIRGVRKTGANLFFVTNNSAKTRHQLYEKLLHMGVDIQEDELINSGYAIGKYLQKRGFKRVLCVGTEDLKQEIAKLGIVPSSDHAEAVVVGYNKDFRLDDLTPLIPLKDENCELIIANLEHSYPISNGKMVPGAGPIVAAVEMILNKKFDQCIGKPNPLMLELVLDGLGISPEMVCVVGDSYSSDVRLAKNYGADAVLISDYSQPEPGVRVIKKLEDLLEGFYD